VQNVKKFCRLRDIKPTVACRESGIGTSFINNIEKGSVPSVDKVQMLASYLGVTTSELLGEEKGPATAAESGLSADEVQVALAYRAADERTKQMVDLALEPWKKSSKFDETM